MTKISVIESEAATRALLKDFLSGKGYEVDVHETPHSLLEQSSKMEVMPEVLIFDLGLLSSQEVANFIPQLKQKLQGAAILLLIESNAVQQAVEGIRQGAFNYILKPLVLSDLGAFIQVAIASKTTKEVEVLFQDYPTLEELEKRYMKAVLEKTRGRKERAAKILGINRRTLYRKEREYGWVMDEDSEFGAEA